MGRIAKFPFIGGIIFAVSALAASEVNPYATIPDRNAFGLREPPAALPPPPPAPVATDHSEFLLTGVVDFRTAKWALITRTERGKPARGYTLAVRQPQDGLEVLDIDAEAGTVRLRHGSNDLVLSLDRSKLEEPGRKYVQQAKPFVDEHTRAHGLREKRETERRELERAAAAAELAVQNISTHIDDFRN